MARSSECTWSSTLVEKVFDSADIVREAMFQQLRLDVPELLPCKALRSANGMSSMRQGPNPYKSCPIQSKSCSPKLLSPVKHRSAQAQADLTVIRARAGLVRARTALVNTVRGLAKSYGERLRDCNVRNMNPEKAEGLSPELQRALEPLLVALESLSEQIAAYNQRIENLAQQSYPQVALLKQIKGVGTLISLTYMLTL